MSACFKRIVFLVCLSLSAHAASAQVKLVRPENIEQAYNKGTRADDGRPGSRYWQNTASYNIKANFDPKSRLLTGTVDIDYVNNSPDTLHEMWFKLYPNLYKKGSPRESLIEPADVNDGVKISKMVIGGTPIVGNKMVIRGTNLSVTGQLVLPKQTVHVTVAYNYTLNKGSHIRTGQVDDGSYFIAYFFPRIAVYDDIDGWNKYPYLGSQEFYNDFCKFDAEITLPGNYLVMATGDLKNPNEVLSPQTAKRLIDAGKSDGVTDIITPGDLKNDRVLNKAATHTWKFSADSVTDFVFAASNHYIWKASSLVVDAATGRRTRVDAIFNPKHKSYYNVVNYARKTVEAMSYKFIKWPYPYAHETVFDGLDQMEYPMMVNDNPVEDKADDIELTVHEIFHTMFPFYMGINETKYGWMDEGWATIGEWLISNMIDPSIKDGYGIESYSTSAGTEEDVPIITLTTQLSGAASFTDSYGKPAMGYLYLKDMLGDELFTKAMHFYISQWHGKHPQPFDFFSSINTASGRNFNWFWKSWFMDGGVPDLALGATRKVGNAYVVTVNNVGTKPVPVDLHVEFENGTKQVFHRDASVWENGRSVDFTMPAGKKIADMTLEELHTPDADRKNNKPVKLYMGKPSGTAEN